jgi:hypothetical protein
MFPDTQEAKTGRIETQGQSRKKVSETLFQQNKAGMIYYYNPSYSGRHR